MVSPSSARNREGLAYLILAVWPAVMGVGLVLALALAEPGSGDLLFAWLGFLIIGAIAISRGFQLLVQEPPVK